MSLSQIYPGRVSNYLAATRAARTVSQGQSNLNLLTTQLGTGLKFQLPSEAPTAATQTLALQKLEERRAAFQASIHTNQGYLDAADTALAGIGDAAINARGILQQGTGDQVTTTERQGLADQVASLIKSVVQAGNTQFNGRYIFAGTATAQAPFELATGGQVRYLGNNQSIAGYADFGVLVDSSIDGIRALQATTTPTSADLNPTLTLNTSLSQLHGGNGVVPQSIDVLVQNGGPVIRKTVDLSSAQTLQDVKARIENAFSAEAITVTVDIDPSSQNALRVTPSAGTVEIRDIDGGSTAGNLGIRSGPTAVVQGADLNPTLSLLTPISSLNGGTGIGATAGTGLRIVNGSQVSVVDLDGATTIQDILNRVRAADPDVIAEISSDGFGLNLSSRLNGSSFSVGENGGQNATLLGVRTLTATTPVSQLNLGLGITSDTLSSLTIERRDGSTATVDLAGSATVQDVLDRINAVDPGVLSASLNAVGNGISLQDTSGSGQLTIPDDSVSRALGLAGSENTGSTGVLIGSDINPQQPQGVLNALVSLERALRDNDVPTLTRLSTVFDSEVNRLTTVRADLGNTGRQLDDIDNLLSDREVTIKGQLQDLREIDYAETITRFVTQQQALQGYLQAVSQSLQLTILQYL